MALGREPAPIAACVSCKKRASSSSVELTCDSMKKAVAEFDSRNLQSHMRSYRAVSWPLRNALIASQAEALEPDRGQYLIDRGNTVLAGQSRQARPRLFAKPVRKDHVALA